RAGASMTRCFPATAEVLITMPVAVRLVEAAGLEVAQVFEHLDPLGLVAADLRRRLSGLDPRP
ncbi:MAG TPA: hypothetical protein PKA64_20390, partial [Myxococcota bacterium]|nr:hypothetical protein [Myxococcota bacterium]